MIIGVCSTKGGAGKTSLCQNLGVAAGEGALILDLDRNGETTGWLQTRRSNWPGVIQGARRENLTCLRKMRGHVLIDTCPNDPDLVAQVAKISDLVVVPSMMSPGDLRAVSETVQIVKDQKRAAQIVIVPMRTRATSNEWRALRPLLEALAPVWPEPVADRTELRAAAFAGRALVETAKRDSVAHNINALWTYIASKGIR